MSIKEFNQQTFDGCAPNWLSPIVSPLIQDIDNNTTLQKIEFCIKEIFPNNSFSEASHTFKFRVLQTAITKGNRGLVCELIQKEGKELVKFHDSSVFSSVNQCQSAKVRFAMLKILIDLGADLEEKILSTISVVELFYNNNKPDVLFLFANRKIDIVSSFPQNKYMEESLESIKKANNFLYFILGKQDNNSLIKCINNDCLMKICEYVAETTIFKEIEIVYADHELINPDFINLYPLV